MKTKEVLQSSFDLLGELMKFNYLAFKEFNDVVTESEVIKERERSKGHWGTFKVFFLLHKF